MIMWNGNLWSNDNVKHYFLWKISSLNLCILFNPEFWSSTILQTRTQCPQLIQHNSITDKVSHTFPVSSVCSKAPPIPPLARRVCRGIGTHHHCLLAYGKKAIMLDKPIVSRISWRYSSSMIRLSIVEVRHHCFTFQPWESMRYSFFFPAFAGKIRYFRNIWLVSSPHCVAVSPNHCWICKCPHHFVGCIGASFFALTWLPGLPENPEHTSIIIRSEMIIPSKL